MPFLFCCGYGMTTKWWLNRFEENQWTCWICTRMTLTTTIHNEANRKKCCRWFFDTIIRQLISPFYQYHAYAIIARRIDVMWRTLTLTSSFYRGVFLSFVSRSLQVDWRRLLDFFCHRMNFHWFPSSTEIQSTLKFKFHTLFLWSLFDSGVCLFTSLFFVLHGVPRMVTSNV